MAYAQTNANRINPVTVSFAGQTAVPQVTYGEVSLCTDPNCPVCRAQRRDKRHKRQKKHHHHRRHRTNFWNSLLPRTESRHSTVSVHSIELDDRRSYVNDRAVVPVNQTERQVATTRRVGTAETIQDAWVEKSPLERISLDRFSF